jgi:hypothetical protein
MAANGVYSRFLDITGQESYRVLQFDTDARLTYANYRKGRENSDERYGNHHLQEREPLLPM